MKRALIAALMLSALPAFAVDKTYGKFSQATLAGSGLNRVWGFGGGAVSPLSIYYSGATPTNNSTQSSTSAVVQITSTATGGWHSVVNNLDGSLVGWWRGEGNANDSIGANNGTWSNTPAYSSGKYGQAMSFDGSNSVVIPGANYNSAYSGSFTLSAWIKPEADGMIVGWNNSANVPYHDFQFKRIDGNASFFSYDGTGRTFTGGTIPLSQWSHVSVTVALNSQVVVYVNGVSNTPTSITTILQPNPNSYDKTYLGTRGNGDNFFNGSIDDVQIYNRALSSNEVASLYDAQANQYTNTFAALSNGVHTLRAYAQDAAGNITNTELRIFTVTP
jgi:hypothetical protein